jgi:hypothetical protein
MGTISASQAWPLPDTDSNRFVPNPGFLGTATITYWAWDQIQGAPQQQFKITATGGSTAFSTAMQIATVLVNTAPLLTP